MKFCMKKSKDENTHFVLFSISQSYVFAFLCSLTYKSEAIINIELYLCVCNDKECSFKIYTCCRLLRV